MVIEAAPFASIINQSLPPKGIVNVARVQRFFNLPQEFVNTFTENWCLLTLYQHNITLNRYYYLMIVHNGRYSELGLVSHMFALPGDADNIRIYEASNYGDYDEIIMAKFNIKWDDFSVITSPTFDFVPHLIQQGDLTNFHRSLQYLLLSFFMEPGDLFLCRDPNISYHENPPAWFEFHKHRMLNFHIFTYAPTFDAQMAVWRHTVDQFGVLSLIQRVLFSHGMRGGRVNPDEEEEEEEEDNIEEEEDLYAMMRGDDEPDFRPHIDRDMFFFDGPGVTNYLRHLVEYGHFRANVNEIYRPTTPRDLIRLGRFFNLDVDFIRTFTPEWNLLIIYQLNRTRNLYYNMAIFHNGRFNNELEVIKHLSPLPGDPAHIRVYESTNYDNYNEIPLVKFNIEWNEFFIPTEPRHRDRYRLLGRNNFTPFHRALQYILLSFYVDPDDGILRPPPDNAPWWYDERRHNSMEHNITQFAKTTDSQMFTNQIEHLANGRRGLLGNIIASHPDIDDD